MSKAAIITTGLDIGYGITKAIVHSQNVVTFPSVAGVARDLSFGGEKITTKYPGDQIEDDHGAYFVGDLALSQIRPSEQIRLRGRTANESQYGNIFRLRMMKAALGKLFPHRKNGDALHLRIATGLPVSHMKDSDDLKAMLMGQHRVLSDQTDFVANVVEVIVMPQPYGTIYSKAFTETGAINNTHADIVRCGVVDIGTYTVDVALDDDGEYIEARSGSTEAGVFTAQEYIKRHLSDKFRYDAGLREIEAVIRGERIKIDGEPVDLTLVRVEALEPMRAATLALLNECWQSARDIDAIYISGGGVPLAQREIKAVYRHAQAVEDSQTANARGYLAYANFIARS